MVAIEGYLGDFISSLRDKFGERLLYVGLQGSYLRNEATENSDIDVMVIIDGFSVGDMDVYRETLISVGDSDKSCGFICGKGEMANWNPLEICQLLHTTKDYYGRLADFLPAYTREDERNFVKLSLGNLFHEICHRYIHADREKSVAGLPMTCKSVFFIVQNMHYLRTGAFVKTKRELIGRLEGEDKKVLEMAASLQGNAGYDFDEAFRTLFAWCQSALRKV